MSTLFNEFDKVSKEDWTKQIISDLKGKDPSALEINDIIEEIKFDAYYHRTDIKDNNHVPGNFPYKRGVNRPDNSWSNSTLIAITDEAEANKLALESLMKGVDTIFFMEAQKNIDWKTVLKDIQFEYIHIRFSVSTIEQYDTICAIVGVENSIKISFNFDFVGKEFSDTLFQELASRLKNRQHGVFTVNGFGVQRIGATTWQEVGFCLNYGHELLVKLINAGLETDEAAACINFNIGVGSNYFFEIAKFRALRQLWAKIVAEYKPKHNCSHNLMITAIVGLTNKSLKDPYTNLLRQTTEVMSAINGGVNNVLVIPFDFYADKKENEIASRMARNISLILKEESYFDKVIDPIGGSYSIEKLTELIGEKAYSQFLKLENSGGIFNTETISSLKKELIEKRAQRIQLFEEGKIIGIGMNKFPNPEKSNLNWLEVPSYLGIEALIFDQISKTVEA